jgi:flagellar biosynthesis component FlhA
MKNDQYQNDEPFTNLLLGLSFELPGLSNPGESLYQEVQQEIISGVDHLLTVLGIPGNSSVQITSPETISRKDRFLRLSINGRNCRYPDELPQRVYSYIVGLHSAQVANKAQISSWVQRENNDQEFATDRNLVDFLKLICLEIIKIQPSVLFGQAQAAAYLSKLITQVSESSGLAEASIFDVVTLRRMLSTLLDLKISIADIDTVYQIMEEKLTGKLSPEEITEHLIVALQSNNIEIQMPGDDLKQMTLAGSENDKNNYSLLRDGLFYELGLYFPEFRFNTNEKLKPGSFAFKINHLTTIPYLALPKGKILVNDAPGRLNLLNIAGIPAINPNQGYEGSLIDIQFKEIAESAGLTTWNQTGYLILSLAGELKRHGSYFVHHTEIEKKLNHLGISFPALVEGVKKTSSVEKITQVLRSLIAEQLSIRNLPLILEQILNYDYIVVDSGKYIVFDDRMPIPKEPNDSWFENVNNLTSFVRTGLKTYLSHKYTRGKNALIVYLLDPEIERILSDNLQEGNKLTEKDHDQILEALQVEVGPLQATISVPTILTTSDIRPYFREIISNEFPGLPVLSYQELSPELNIQPVARISLVN